MANTQQPQKSYEEEIYEVIKEDSSLKSLLIISVLANILLWVSFGLTMFFTSIFKFIGLAILFFYYYTLPMSYSKFKIHEMIKSWARFGIAILTAIIIGITFGSQLLSGLSIASITAAFLVTIPKVRGISRLNTSTVIIIEYIVFLSLVVLALASLLPSVWFFSLLWYALPLFLLTVGNVYKVYWEDIFKLANSSSNLVDNTFKRIRTISTILSIVALAILGSSVALFPQSGIMTFVMIVLVIGSAVGWYAGRAGRPLVGVIVLAVAMLGFSVQFTGALGAAMFGDYWPTVEHYGSMIAEPIGAAIGSVQQTMHDAYLMMTCPSCYYAEQQKKQQVQGEGTVKEGGTVKSLEFTNFEAISYATANPEIDPNIPLIGSIEMENQGEFVAKGANVTLIRPRLRNPLKVGGAYSEDEQWDNVPDSDKCVFTGCTAGRIIGKDKCKWDTPIKPGELRLLTFKCPEKGSWSDDVNKPGALNVCRCCDSEGNCGDKISCDSDCSGDKPIKTYFYGGQYLQIGFNYDFEYTVNVTIPATVMNKTLFESKLLAKEITLQSAEYKYSGGPLKATIWLQRQPLRSGEESYGRISIVNEGSGKVKSATLELYLPNFNGELKSTGKVASVKLKCNDNWEDAEIDGKNYKKLTCNLNGELGPQDYASYMFSFKYNIPDDIDQKSFILLGSVDYTYEGEYRMEFPIIRAPITG